MATIGDSQSFIDTDTPQRFNPQHSGDYHGISPEARVVANWHDEAHPGAFSMCQEQPCAAVKLVDGGPGEGHDG